MSWYPCCRLYIPVVSAVAGIPAVVGPLAAGGYFSAVAGIPIVTVEATLLLLLSPLWRFHRYCSLALLLPASPLLLLTFRLMWRP